MKIEAKLSEMGLALPAELALNAPVIIECEAEIRS